VILFRAIYRGFLEILRRSESKTLGTFFTNVSLSVAKILKVQEIPLFLRQFISLAQPSDPLKDENLPTIDIAIPCHGRDFVNLPLVIEGARKSTKNPIGKLHLITPSLFATELQSKFPDCLVSTDEDVLGEDLIKAITDLAPNERRGWFMQQAIKLRISMLSAEVATLIVDADTILLRPKVWLDSKGRQILSISNEYHHPYKEHLRRMFGWKSYLLSFVTHHQLMKKESLIEIFGQDGEDITKWLKLADFSESSAICEYETYGEFMMKCKSDEIMFSKWNNISEKIFFENGNLDYAKVKARYSKYGSISNHHYL
jgi:hypothetical protein